MGYIADTPLKQISSEERARAELFPGKTLSEISQLPPTGRNYFPGACPVCEHSACRCPNILGAQVKMDICQWCGLTHTTKCSLVKEISYWPDGSIKKVKFLTAADYANPSYPMPYPMPVPPYIPNPYIPYVTTNNHTTYYTLPAIEYYPNAGQ